MVLRNRGRQRYFSKTFAILSLKNTSAISFKFKIHFQKYVGYNILNHIVTCNIYQYKLQ